jgi:hypothetical protein
MFHCPGVNGTLDRAVCATVAALALMGCATVVTTAQGQRLRTNSGEFRDYAEEVFRTHNEVATSLAYALDDVEAAGPNTGPYQRLANADDRMMKACSPLDELAVARRDNRQVSLRQLTAMARSVPDCERATLAAQASIAAALDR